MTVICWISLGLFTVAVFLFIFGIIKDFKILANISRFFIIPTSNVIAFSLLLDSFPDARHIFFLSSIALSLIIISEFCFIFEKLPFFNYTAKLFFIASSIFWIELYKSTFFIYTIPLWINITAGSIYFIFYIFHCICCLKKPLHFYLGVLIMLSPLVLLNYSALITLIFSRKLYSMLLFTGTLLLILSYSFYSIHNSINKTNKAINQKLFILVRVISLVIAEAMINYSGLLMIR